MTLVSISVPIIHRPRVPGPLSAYKYLPYQSRASWTERSKGFPW